MRTMDETSQAGNGATSLLDPAERSRRGTAQQAQLLRASRRGSRHPLRIVWRDYVFAEVWTRPGLDLRVALSHRHRQRGGRRRRNRGRGLCPRRLGRRRIDPRELREAVLHTAVLCAGHAAACSTRAVTRAADTLGLAPAETPAIRADHGIRQRASPKAVKAFGRTCCSVRPHPDRLFRGRHSQFRVRRNVEPPRLDQRARRWLTWSESAFLVAHPIRSHVWSAMKSAMQQPTKCSSSFCNTRFTRLAARIVVQGDHGTGAQGREGLT